jgi:large subunit ribosomal protein L23
MKDPFQIIKRIRLSEKATLLGETNNEYVFVVDTKATKIDIRNAIKTLYGKKATEVRTMQYEGKDRRKKRADAGRTNHWKKAVVRLAEGEKIELF